MKSRKQKFLRSAGGALAVLAVITVLAGLWYARHHLPAELLPDLRAAIAARDLPSPDARFRKYLEGRYGSLEDPANRARAFEGFFDPEHIRAMQFIVKHSPPAQRGANIQATAHWLEQYRQSLSLQEATDLGSYFQSDAGRTALQEATAQFMNQDPEYRSATSPVIMQLMTTLAAVRK